MHYTGAEDIDGQSDTAYDEHGQRLFDEFEIEEPLHGLQENRQCECEKKYAIKECTNEFRPM